MRKTSSFCLGLLGLVALSLLCPQQAKALDSQYLRNGECYLLIGEGDSSLRGVYRLNNPAANPVKYYKNNRVISGSNIKDTLGFNVDLNRKIYTFTEQVESTWQVSSSPLYRQVLDDGVTADQADYGYHSYIHYDHRSWNQGDIYRTGPVGRDIHRDGGGAWGSFKSAGPGTAVSGDYTSTLPSMTGAASLGRVDGKKWYQIPNASWYSNWKTGAADPMGDYGTKPNGKRGYLYNGFNTFYYVFGDKVQEKNHNYKLWTWNPNDPEKDTPTYTKNIGDTVAVTKEQKISRNVYAGCLDGCGGASGSGSAQPLPMLNDIAFQPPLKDQGSRTYFYSRTKGGTDGKISKNNSPYNPSSGNPLIGLKDSTDTFWLCISLRNVTTDFVYCLGTNVIKDWYSQAFGSAPSNMNITAVTVSNQWDQQGGIVYAYDKANKKIYKFERKETTGTPISKEKFLALDLGTIMNEIDALQNSELDDIKADGFGSLYFAMSHPSKNVDSYNPAQHFKPSDCIHVHKKGHDDNKKETTFTMLFKQDYGKKVFERNYLTGDITQIGSKDFASRIYNVECKIKDPGWEVIKNYPTGCNFSRLETELASWTATISGKPYQKEWPSNYYQRGKGACNCSTYKELNYNDPGQAKLAVINVPTPPKVISLGNKKSYLDIVGPYLDVFAIPDKVNRNTNQGDGLLNTSNLSTDQLYFYMVENYPLDDGAQDPTAQPNWDADGRMGGFITSVQDPAPYNPNTHPSGVKYEWRTWMVLDLYGNCTCRLIKKTDVKSGYPYHTIYSSVPGKFIITCRATYNWYDYDALPFGSTVDDLSKVLHSDEKAIPVAASGISAQWASDRLNQIINTFKYKGPNTNNKEILFMKSPVDKKGNPISVDYSPIVADENGGNYLALEPISIGEIGEAPVEPTVKFPITRCDNIPGVATDSYMNTDSFWSPVDPEDKVFGIAAGEVYNWRIDKDAQAYMFKDISKFNGTSDSKAANYNYLAHQMLTPGSGYYRNTAKAKFINNLGDLYWTDKKIYVSAKLIYKVPNGSSYKEISLPLKQAQDNSSSIGSDYEFEYTVKDESQLWQTGGNIPVYYTTAGNLPPTDPMDARIQITMRREYMYTFWSLDREGQPSYPSDISGEFKITGEATVRIIDTNKPKVDWEKTAPNNLFALTGGELKKGVGPSGMVNPENVNFTVTDNNPWEAVETEEGLEIEAHIRNINTNYGYEYCESYCKKNSYLEELFEDMKKNLPNTTGIKNDIESKKKNKQMTSDLNYKPLFSRQARDVRIGFETVSRDSISGKVTLDKADNLFASVGRKFQTDNDSDYAVHYRAGNDHNAKYQKSLSLSAMSYSRTVGATTVYDSTLDYSVPVNSIKIGNTNSGSSQNRVPDGYANNTPGYRKGNDIRPYKFFVSLTDSSGNYTGEKELNVVLNVKDDIPPIGYGSVYDAKNDLVSFFPYEIDPNNDVATDPVRAPSYRVSGEDYYFSQTLNDTFLRGNSWASNDSTALVKYNTISGPYKAMLPVESDSISTGLKDNEVYINLVKDRIPPLAVEDNVECLFRAYVNDNCGNATATLTLKYFDTDGRNGQQNEVSRTVRTSNGWISAASVDGATNLNISSSTAELNALFRGNSSQFPMAIPITIVSEDNARDWDYYLGGNVNDSGDWSWGTVHFGKDSHNKRTFKTSLPVFGHELDIRTLDKSIQNR